MGRQAGCFLNSTSCAVPVLGQKCIAKGMKVRLLPAGGCCMLVDAACWWVLQQMPAELSASKFQLSAIAHSYS